MILIILKFFKNIEIIIAKIESNEDIETVNAEIKTQQTTSHK